jgi:esterase/lipase
MEELNKTCLYTFSFIPITWKIKKHLKERLNIEKSVSSLKIPHLIIHGDSDPTVDIKEAEDLHSWNPNSKFIVFKDADHVFGGCHPFSENVLPHFLQRAVDDTIDFIQ